MRLLFIGNSATYVHEIPQTLAARAAQQGHCLTVNQCTPGGYTLAQHADAATEHGQRVLSEIAKGYDIVFLQDNGNCIATPRQGAASLAAARTLAAAVKQSGARLYYYVRPPYGIDNSGYDPFAQCVAFGAHFGASARETGAVCVYVNRAFAHAMHRLPFDLWGEDHAHTSLHGAHLIVCTFYATLFGQSAAALPAGDLPAADALALARVADRIALEGYIPWEEQ